MCGFVHQRTLKVKWDWPESVARKLWRRHNITPRLGREEGRSSKSWQTDKHLNINTNGVTRRSKGKSRRMRERKRKKQRRDC